jgi:RNA recognition motif-containing protein
LDFNATVDNVRDLFLPFGEVDNVIIPPNRTRPWQSNRGFAFVDMPDPAAARRAIAGLNGEVIDSKALQVEETRGRSGGRL